ncbi:ABC transporter substrate-binding protein [Paenibacillus sp. KN14-4R]|uniref:ABC transporter substrate-binding protein n=1 Tax=Paenibacillus sp. KN14-4R TaxID=3445773 RepID=UPI003FA0CEC4
MSRKWLRLATTATLMLVMIIATACGSKGENQATPSTGGEAGTAKAGGSIVIAVQDDPKAINPLYASDRVTLTIDQTLFAPFFNINDGKKSFVLAESLTPSEDHLKYTMKLRSGLTWHDGQKLTADDVVFTFKSILDEKQHSFLRSLFVLDGKPIEVTKVDELTVEFKLPQVTAAFEGALVQVSPIPKHIFEGETDLEKSTKNATPVGSGTYKFKEYRPGEYVTLERFDNYFGGKGNLDTITYRVAKDANASNLALQNGEIQMKMIDTQDFKKLNDSGKFEMLTYPEGRLSYMVYNFNIDVLKKKEVRLAIAYALDKNELIKAAYSSSDFAEPAPSVLTPDTLYHSKDVPTYDYNLDKAKELLNKAGVSGLKLKLAYANSNKAQASMALFAQQKLKEIGIELQLMPMDITAYGNKTLDKNNKDFDLFFNGYIMGSEPDSYKSLFMSDAEYNYSHYVNKDLDALWIKAAVEVDDAKRADLYKQIQHTLADELPVLPIAYTKAIVAVDKKYGGLQEATPKPVVMFENLAKIFLK